MDFEQYGPIFWFLEPEVIECDMGAHGAAAGRADGIAIRHVFFDGYILQVIEQI
jgi:hypothetical protein